PALPGRGQALHDRLAESAIPRALPEPETVTLRQLFDRYDWFHDVRCKSLAHLPIATEGRFPCWSSGTLGGACGGRSNTRAGRPTRHSREGGQGWRTARGAARAR